MSEAFITPTIASTQILGRTIYNVLEPDPYPGHEDAHRVAVRLGGDGARCERTHIEYGVATLCPLTEGHDGPHWKAHPDVVAECGTIELVPVAS